jgi:hypothetical protein
MTPEQIKIFRSMTPGRKLELAMALYESARRLKEAALRQQHPDWDADTVRNKVRELFCHASS